MKRKKKNGNQKDTLHPKDIINLITAIVNAVRSIIDLIERFTE